ncbi:hypothetical protein [Prosthecochloris sp.]|uniref:hypothetical protein n=1 Tax=Prosthecochloris sp. TaxID=290513 RepID=UPI00257D84CC|nr:hypothetical protein [Prosthecochloris sp.]
MKNLLSLFLIGMLFVSGCQSTLPKDALIMSNESLATRQQQTRKYETKNEGEILSAVSGVLQDMGFNLNESESKLGVISASKKRSAVDAGQQTMAVFIALLGGGATATDKDQTIRASVVTRPFGEDAEYIAVRVTFQRMVWNTRGQVTTAECVDDEEIYQGFFDKLSKSIFLEAQEI